MRDRTDGDWWIDAIEWTFGDGTTGNAWWTQHAYDAVGSYTVALSATDNEGRTTVYELVSTDASASEISSTELLVILVGGCLSLVGTALESQM